MQNHTTRIDLATNYTMKNKINDENSHPKNMNNTFQPTKASLLESVGSQREFGKDITNVTIDLIKKENRNKNVDQKQVFSYF